MPWSGGQAAGECNSQHEGYAYARKLGERLVANRASPLRSEGRFHCAATTDASAAGSRHQAPRLTQTPRSYRGYRIPVLEAPCTENLGHLNSY